MHHFLRSFCVRMFFSVFLFHLFRIVFSSSFIEMPFFIFFFLRRFIKFETMRLSVMSCVTMQTNNEIELF